MRASRSSPSRRLSQQAQKPHSRRNPQLRQQPFPPQPPQPRHRQPQAHPHPKARNQIESQPGYLQSPSQTPQPRKPIRTRTPIRPTARRHQRQSHPADPLHRCARLRHAGRSLLSPTTTAARTSRSIAGSTPPCCASTPWATSTTMYLSMRPYTRRSALHILQASEDAILSSDDIQAQDILSALLAELTDEGITGTSVAGPARGTVYGVQSLYTRITGSLRQHPRRQLPSRPDLLQRLWPPPRVRLQQHHRLLYPQRARPFLALRPRRVPARALRLWLLAGARHPALRTR